MWIRPTRCRRSCTSASGFAKWARSASRMPTSACPCRRRGCNMAAMHPPALARWHELVSTRNVRGLDDLIADGCVFHSPVVHTPQAGKSATVQYLGAAFRVFFNPTFRYVREVAGVHDAVLEF